MRESNWKTELKKEGINFLEGENKEVADSLIKELNTYGLFPVYVGEVECWLRTVDSSDHGDKWLIKKLQSMGQNISEGDYVKPDHGDVWDFIGQINEWLSNASRKGM